MKWLRRAAWLALAWRLFGPTIQPRFRPPQEHPWRLSGRTVYVGDEEYLVREAGPADGEPILLIHGLGGSSLSEWYQVAPKLATERRVVMVDHRSHGLSALASARYDVDAVADEIAAVLDELEIGLVDVVGYSMGGAIAQAMARRHPRRVGKLVLIATFTSHTARLRLLRRAGALIARAWERATGTGTPEVRAGYLLSQQAVERRHARWLWNETHRRNPDAGAQATFALLRFDSDEWIGKLEAPTLVLIPTEDLLVPPRWQYRLAAQIEDVTVVEVPGARHEVVWTHPDEILAALDSFL